MLAGIYEPTDFHTDRVTSYTPHLNNEDAPNFSMLEFPVNPKKLSSFERRNKISVNIYSIDDETTLGSIRGKKEKCGVKRKHQQSDIIELNQIKMKRC